MQIEELDIPGLLLITPARHGDARGFFSEVFRQDRFQARAGPVVFVQDNVSRSAKRGTVRGLHYQAPPHAQGKLVRVARGAVLDVAVDVREGSATYGRHAAVELSEESWHQLWVPPGFLHGFFTLTDDVELAYKVTDYYDPECDGAVAWNDPDLAIAWPADVGDVVVSDKDRRAPAFRDWRTPFEAG